MISFLLFLQLHTHSVEPFLLKSTTDIARIIGLPRLKTMDRVMLKSEFVGEFEHGKDSQRNPRLSFLVDYVKVNNFVSLKGR